MPLTSGYRLYRTKYVETAGCASPDLYPLTATEHTLQETQLLIQRGFTATPARCWAALYDVDDLSIRAAKAVCLCLARAASRHVCPVSRKRRDHSGRHRQSPTFVPTKSLQHSCFIGRAWPKFPAVCRAFRKNANKKCFSGIGGVPRFRNIWLGIAVLRNRRRKAWATQHVFCVAQRLSPQAIKMLHVFISPEARK